MSTIIPVDPEETDDAAVDAAAEVLKKGEMIIYPTETLYGLGVDCENAAAVSRLYNIKKRDTNKPVHILASDIGMVIKYADLPSANGIKLMDTFWPGPLTLVFKAQPAVQGELTGNTGTVGIRVPGSIFCRSLVARLGRGLTATSANYSGDPGNCSIWDIPEQLRKAAAMILHGGECPGSVPSTVLSVVEDIPVILREGAVDRDSIEECLGMEIR